MRKTGPGLQTRPHFRLQVDQGVAIGPGKAVLLEKIAETGSISQAGRAMGMGYRTAWLLVDSMNHHFKSPLVACSRGGISGGGARLTPLGRDVLRHYRNIERKALRAVATEVAKLRVLLRA